MGSDNYIIILDFLKNFRQVSIPYFLCFNSLKNQDYLCTISKDEDKCDLLIVMGTSLQVAPVNKIPNSVPRSTPRLLINREQVKHSLYNRTVKLSDLPTNALSTL